MQISIGAFSHSVGAIFLILLMLSQIKVWDKQKSSRLMLVATVASFIWCSTLIFPSILNSQYFFIAQILEVLKNILWFLVLLNYLGLKGLFSYSDNKQLKSGILSLTGISVGIPLALIAYLLFLNIFSYENTGFPAFGGMAVISGFLFNSIAGLALLEQVIRNTNERFRYHLKFLCLGLGVIYFFDLYMYSDALLFGRIDSNFWDVRGIVQILAVPLIIVSINRTHKQPAQVNISRRLVFHSGVLLATGIYLLLMSTAGYYIRSSAGEWGIVLQILFWLIGAGALITAAFSGRLRSQLKFYISRNLFTSRYDYREEWLRISKSLAFSNSEESLPKRSIQAMADILDSPGGALWLSRDNVHFDQIAEVEMGWVENGGLLDSEELIVSLNQKKWIVDLTDENDSEYLKVRPDWLVNWKKAWLLIPLLLNDKLLGFIILRHPRVAIKLNWEDFDILKTVAQQTSSYLAQMIATEALSMAQQFTAFNQMSAFVVHDIKTLNSQLSLLVSNAATHKTNPEFIEDMITTTQHAVQKMDFLLDHFKNNQQVQSIHVEEINLCELVNNVVETQTGLKPYPLFISDESEVLVNADWQEMKTALGHLIKNAQEATPDDGKVSITLNVSDGNIQLVIVDTGEGMTEDFIHTQLYLPFQSTKGLSGMGIGVYQSREYIRKSGGDLMVNSIPGEGTEFIITLSPASKETGE